MVAAARAWGRLAVVACGTMCQAPKTRAKYRKAWGCDEPTTQPVAAIPCYVCFGDGKPCETCKSRGSLRLTRCPTYYLTYDVMRMYDAYRWYREGHLPVQGGFLDQTAQFVEAVPFLASAWQYFLDSSRED